MLFRKDINGLRAIAVIAVVLFHFNESWLPGGFSGVDIFFVISGFLMTRIIFKGIDQNNFSILKFYIARANRIIPPLALLCFVLLVFGYIYLIPQEYKTLSEYIISSVGFFSNITYWQEAGYFDSSSYEKWLLHTWSLSVEWQFYIIYPLVLITLKKYIDITGLKVVLLIGTILGFVFCVAATYKWPTPSYYLLPTRAWEMMLGGIAYLYPLCISNRKKIFLEYIGLTLIIGSYFLISKETPWPGYHAFFPVFGTYLLIQAQRNDSVITGNIAMQQIGSWSYSIYLWHWPIVVAIYYFTLSNIYTYIGIVLSIILGFLSYKYVEQAKFRNNFSSLFDYLKCKPIYMAAFISFLSLFIFKNNYYLYSIPKHIYAGMTVDNNTDNNDDYTWFEHRRLDKKEAFKNATYKILIIGDSQSGDFINTLYETGLSPNVDVISRIVSLSCGVFYLNEKDLKRLFKDFPHRANNHAIQQNCEQSIGRIRKSSVVKNADIIIVSMSWRDIYIPSILKSISNIRTQNPEADLYIVGGKKFSEEVPNMIYKAYSKNMDLGDYTFDKIPRDDVINYYNQNKIFGEAQEKLGYRYINMTDLLCSNNQCKVTNKLWQPFYYDTGHLTRSGAKFLGLEIKSKLLLPQYIYQD